MRRLGFGLLIACAPLLVAACAAAPSTPSTAPTAGLPATVPPGDLPAAVEYSLGEATIVQERFPEDSRFRNMPVRLNGLIAAPSGEGGPYPVVAILHGTHPGCPVDETEVDRWPCDPEVEQANYQGFEYLVRELAARGYVALSININAENTFGFGEPVPGERLQQLVDLHLQALAEAAAGGANDFGVELEGRADVRRLALVGHSRGGEAILGLARQQQSDAEAGADPGHGPAAGLLLVAPAVVSLDPSGGSPMPMAIILPACDGDVAFQEGQHFYEAARLAPQQTEWATSAWLESANHNSFNQLLADDPFGRPGRPDCETLLEPEAQRGYLADYAADFLTAIWEQDPAAVRGALGRLGMDVQTLAPGELYGLPARVAMLAPAAGRQRLLVPATADELATNLQGGNVTEEGITTHFCPKGYYTPAMLPGSEPCRRVNLTIPGQPAHAVVSWAEPGGAWRFALPAGAGDLSGYTALSLRAAVDPLSPLNAPGTHQAITVQLTDRAGNTVTMQTRLDEPALGFPAGLVGDSDPFEGGLFTGRVPMTTIRLLLSGVEGVDLAAISEIALLFDQTASGSLFLGDIEWVKSSHP